MFFIWQIKWNEMKWKKNKVAEEFCTCRKSNIFEKVVFKYDKQKIIYMIEICQQRKLFKGE